MNCEEMISRIKQGDSSFFNSLVSEFDEFLNQTISATYIEGCDSDDLLQISYIAMFLAIMNYQPDKANDFKMYMEQAVRNSLLYEIEKRKRQGCTISLNNLSSNDYKLISSNPYNRHLMDSDIDARDKKKFLLYVFKYGKYAAAIFSKDYDIELKDCMSMYHQFMKELCS